MLSSRKRASPTRLPPASARRCSDVMAAGRDMLARLQQGYGGGGPRLTVLEEQLMGCRTFKGQEIPYVDTTASLAVLEGYSEQERRVAEAYTAAVAACTDFECLKRANKLVGGRGGVGWRDGGMDGGKAP